MATLPQDQQVWSVWTCWLVHLSWAVGFSQLWWIQGTTPATFTAVGIDEITVWGLGYIAQGWEDLLF